MKNANRSLLCVVYYCIILTLAVPPQLLFAQAASVTFNVDGSVDVKNRVLYLQTTALLDLQELYRVPLAPGTPQGIMMWTTSLFNPNAVQYGPDARVEVRVFDYDDEQRSKGALIYAATGAKSGWNEDTWDERNSMFVDGAAVSEKVRALFDTRKINTTNIKVLSQFEGVGSQCIEPGTSGIFTYGFLNGLFFSFAEPLAVSVQAVGAHLIAAYASHVAVTAAANAAHAAANLANMAASAADETQASVDESIDALQRLYDDAYIVIGASRDALNAANALIDNYNVQNYNAYIATLEVARETLEDFNQEAASASNTFNELADNAVDAANIAAANVAAATNAANTAGAAYAANAVANAALATRFAQAYAAYPDVTVFAFAAHLAAFVGSYGAYLLGSEVDFRLFDGEYYKLKMKGWPTPLLKWCHIVAPMPVVLVEVAVRNAQLEYVKIPGLPLLTADHFLSSPPIFDTESTARFIRVEGTKEQLLTEGYTIVDAPFSTVVAPEGFSKYDHIKMPDLSTTVLAEFRLGNWARVPLVGTYERLRLLQSELEGRARSAGVDAAEFFSFRHISHNFMKVKRDRPVSVGTFVGADTITYELWHLTINKKFGRTLLTTVTPEGPFEASNGLDPDLPRPLEAHNHEILSRSSFSHSTNRDKAADNRAESIAVYPNPAIDAVKVRFHFQESSHVKVVVHNVVGRVVHEEATDLAAGTHTIVFDLSTQPPGMYLISITTQRLSASTKLLIRQR